MWRYHIHRNRSKMMLQICWAEKSTPHQSDLKVHAKSTYGNCINYNRILLRGTIVMAREVHGMMLLASKGIKIMMNTRYLKYRLRVSSKRRMLTSAKPVLLTMIVQIKKQRILLLYHYTITFPLKKML